MLRTGTTRWAKGRLVLALFGAILISPAAISSSLAQSTEDTENVIAELPHCEIPRAEASKRLLYVSTLDGKISALDITNQGSVKWSVDTGSSLLSSSIHKLDLTSNGKWVRMIPSLSGGLYKFDGESIEAIPLKAEDLLRSSFKFSDDIVMSGGMQTSSYGVSASSGSILYECSLSGCQNFTHSTEPIGPKELQHNPTLDDVLIVRRETQTVRAIEPREGVERWNFSIGMHYLEMIKSADCQGQSGQSELDVLLSDLEFKAVVPEGIICAFSKANPSQVLWIHQFEFPIVSAWRADATKNVDKVDFFAGADWLWNGKLGLYSQKETDIAPSLYLGMYEKQPYIQESDKLQQLSGIKQTDPVKMISEDTNYHKIPFKPYPATKDALDLIEDHSNNKEEQTTEKQKDENPTAVATSVLYASEYVNGNGFYFYTKNDLNSTQKAVCDSDDPHSEDENMEENLSFVKRTLSILYQWKEVCIFIITSAAFVHLFLNNRPHEKEYVVVEKHVPVAYAREAIEGVNYSKGYTSQGSSSESNYSESSYQSRFVSDYDVEQVLGKGGFGVVFAAKNKVDDCQYAIKRIILPSRQESRERVMREVKTLAHCDHQNIVRYFNSWIENPPPGWQEERDKMLRDHALLSTSIDIGTPTESNAVSFSKINSVQSFQKPNQFLNFNNKNTLNGFDLSDFNGHSTSNGYSHIAFEENSHVGNETKRDDDSDSHIVFQNDSEKSSDVVVPISHTDEDSVSFRGCNKRPMSLDLHHKTKEMIFSFPQQVNKTYLYIQMQLCQKHSLKEWLSQKTYTERKDQVIPIFEQIVGAVEYVHLKGLIHRDLKPGNIFFALDGQIKIGDFGLVTDMAEEPHPHEGSSTSQQCRHTQRVGTHLYMSPEQIAGLPYNYKVDIYSLGLILFELYVTFCTEMERINTLKSLRLNEFPSEFQQKFDAEYKLLKLMLSQKPTNRPTTFGIRARPPLQHSVSNESWHFEMPPRPRRDSRNSGNGVV